MLKIYTMILGIFLLVVSLGAQDNLPIYSAVQYEIQADSLMKTNEPQEMLISISAASSGDIDAYEVKIYDYNIRISQLIGANKEFILERIPFISSFIYESIDEVVNNSDVIVVVNNESEFKNILEQKCKNKIVYDLVNINIENKSEMSNYVGISW